MKNILLTSILLVCLGDYLNKFCPYKTKYKQCLYTALSVCNIKQEVIEIKDVKLKGYIKQ